ncbi:prenyltransferase/squalene oxidase repeat-containing protein [Embleya sp. NBC_00896]|uniref:prenyltransferase/squalene oxidase repeat-containing protein n=1 Tax=Embleya sp. NBC_00896 TaxID=2975961 RepID=UPI003864F476|nr:hypothetical protein OG928_03640 [Embleya sp. NBC_00896]
MSWLTVGNTCAAAVCGAVLIAAAPALAGPSAAAPTNPYAEQATAAASWQAHELVDGGIPGFAGSDWGLTIDTVFALAATGANPAALNASTDAVAANVRKYNGAGDEYPDVWIAGATAKILVGAVAAGRDPKAFGGFDLRRKTLDLVAGPEAGSAAGRVRDKIPNEPGWLDNSNAFGQSLAVIGLARSGGVPQPVVDFLLKQQCAVGGFRLSPDAFGSAGATCDETPNQTLDPDSTGMAVQALLAADAESKSPGARAAADKGAAWLVSIQRADGSFGGSGPTVESNTNSTGLAGQALAAIGHKAEAAKAAAWVAKHQITRANAGKADAEIGTIAYNEAALTSARTEGIPDFQRDQWRRATPQALLTLADVALGDLGRKPVEPEPSTTVSASPTATATPTTTTSATATPTTSLTQTASASVTTSATASATASASTSTTAAGTVGGAAGGSVSGGGSHSGTTGTGGLAKTGARIGGLLLLSLGLVGTGIAVRAGARRKNGTHT